MKRAFILLLATLGLASACLGQAAPTNQPDSPHIKPPTAAKTPAAKTPNSLEQTLIAKEEEVWEKIRGKDMQGFSSLLAEDFVYVTDDGIHSKAASVKRLAEATVPDFSLDDWKVVKIDKDAAIVTYKAMAVPTAAGLVMRNASVWAKRGGKWLVVFHQDTVAASGGM